MESTSGASISAIPAMPELGEDARASGAVPVRYEDITQDGRVVLIALPHALGAVMWPQMAQSQVAALGRTGIVPILARMVLEGTDETVSAVRPLRAESAWALGSSPSTTQGRRLFLNMWATVKGRRGRTYGGKREGDGEEVVVGRIFAEHVFTRPFAPKEERRVQALPIGDGQFVPPLVHQSRGIAELVGDAARDLVQVDRVAFGMMHSDSNQHVNSLVYPQLAEEAALRALLDASHAAAATALARRCEVVWRKPCFAGERISLLLRVSPTSTGADVLAVFADDGALPSVRAGELSPVRAAMQMSLRSIA